MARDVAHSSDGVEGDLAACRNMFWAFILLFLHGTAFGDAAKGDWHPGRATYFDAPQYWKDSFQPGKFGDLYGNSCQYLDRRQGVTPSNADFPLPMDGVGAITDVMPYHTGEEQNCWDRYLLFMPCKLSRM